MRTSKQSENESVVSALGSRVHLLSTEEIVDTIESWISDGARSCRRVVVTGFHGLWAAHEDDHLKTVLNSAEIWAADGIAPVWLARLRGHKNLKRATGTDIMREFFSRANSKGYRSFFYGDTDETLAALCRRLENDYPGHVVAGTFSPPYRPLTPEEDTRIIEMINDLKPDILWVGLGMPKQDRWIYDHLDRLNVPVAIGVGAAFAFIAGTVDRCPEWIGSAGLEWMYRLAKEPRKVWRRDLIDGPRFLLQIGLELTGLRKYD